MGEALGKQHYIRVLPLFFSPFFLPREKGRKGERGEIDCSVASLRAHAKPLFSPYVGRKGENEVGEKTIVLFSLYHSRMGVEEL